MANVRFRAVTTSVLTCGSGINYRSGINISKITCQRNKMGYISMMGLFLFTVVPIQCLPAQNVSTQGDLAQNVSAQSVPAQSESAQNVTAQNVPFQGVTPEERECLEDNKVWNSAKKKCRSCKPCSYGTGRSFKDFENLPRKRNGDMSCPPCIECPQGFYNDRKKSVRCSTCATVCATRNRHVQEECKPTSDAKCGACLPGYEDKYGNIDFPCSKIRNLDPGTPEAPRFDAAAERPVKNITGIMNSKEGTVHLPKPQNGKEVIISLTSVAAVLGAILLSLTVVFCCRKYRPSRNRRKRGYTITPTSYSPSKRNLTEDSDLETDNPVEHHEQIGRRIAEYHRQTSDDGKKEKRSQRARRASYGNNSFVRAEDGRSLDTSGPCARRSIQWRDYPRIGKKCRCQLIPLCGCYNVYVLTSGKDISLDRNNHYFPIVSRHVCHDPTPLFEGLGIPYSDIYQINNDRDRDPEKLSESEMVQRLLNRWIEIKPQEATLTRLCTELCNAGFHSITQEILNDLPVQEAHAH